MRQKVAACYLVVAALLAPTLAPGEERWRLRLAPPEGATYRYAMTLDQDMEMNLGPLGTQTGHTHAVFEQRQSLRERRADGASVLDTTIERIRIAARQGTVETSFDTAAEPAATGASTAAPNPFSSLRELMSRTFTTVVSYRGEVLEVSGFEHMWGEMDKSLPEAARRTLEGLKQSFGPEAMKAMMQQAFSIYGDEYVHVGSEWTSELNVPNPALGTMHVTHRYRVLAPESRNGKRCLKLAITPSMQILGKSPLLAQFQQLLSPAGNVSIDMTLEDASGEGILWVDTASGMPVFAEATATMKMGMHVDVKGEQAGQLQMTLTLVQRMRNERID